MALGSQGQPPPVSAPTNQGPEPETRQRTGHGPGARVRLPVRLARRRSDRRCDARHSDRRGRWFSGRHRIRSDSQRRHSLGLLIQGEHQVQDHRILHLAAADRPRRDLAGSRDRAVLVEQLDSSAETVSIRRTSTRARDRPGGKARPKGVGHPGLHLRGIQAGARRGVLNLHPSTHQDENHHQRGHEQTLVRCRGRLQ